VRVESGGVNLERPPKSIARKEASGDNHDYAGIADALFTRHHAGRKTLGCRPFRTGRVRDYGVEDCGRVTTGSLGILSEAAHSGLDLIAALITFLSVRVSDKPADADHQYGHGKVENFSAFIETGLLLLTCVWIISEAIKRLFFESIEIERRWRHSR